MKKGFIFDLDGTIYLDNQLIKGSAETIDFLRNRGHHVVFFTNKSIATRTDYVKKLNHLGIRTSLEDIINSNYVTARFLKQKMNPSELAYVIGEKALYDELEKEGILITEDANLANYIVLGWDRQFTYEKLKQAYMAWRNNHALIIATNPDRTCPTAEGPVPDCGALIGAFEGVSGIKIDHIMGKPSRFATDLIVNHILKLKPEQCYIVGDRLETDIHMGNVYGLHTILVLTGISTQQTIKTTGIQPEYILESVKEIMQMSEITDCKAERRGALHD